MAATGMPRVEFIAKDFARWTFTSADRATQDAEFHFWRGYFGFEEDNKPEEVGGSVWFVRRRASGAEGAR